MRKFVFILLCLLMTASAFALDLGSVELEQSSGTSQGGTKIHFSPGSVGGAITPSKTTLAALALSDANPKTQMSLQTKASIPCFLGIAVYRAENRPLAGSSGPEWDALNNQSSRWSVLFDRETCDLIDQNWEIVQGSTASQLFPNSDFPIFLEADSTFFVVIYSNDAYIYEVQASPLKFTGEDVNINDLPLDMLCQLATVNDPSKLGRTVFGSGSIGIDDLEYSETVEMTFTDSQVVGFDNRPYCTFTVIKHRFRVPYELSIRHGEYIGVVTFRVYTL